MTELAKVNEYDRLAETYDMELVRDQICKGASPGELTLFLLTCNRTGLDPFARQIYYIPGKPPITSIDGYRLVAQRSGEYAGQTEPLFWNGEKWVNIWTNNCTAARVGVYRKGFAEAMFAVARLEAYMGNGPVWKKMPDVMLSKCAEALALRKAFPQELSGLYTAEEMHQSEADPQARGAQLVEDCMAAGDYQKMPMMRTPLKEALNDVGKIHPNDPDIDSKVTGIVHEYEQKISRGKHEPQDAEYEDMTELAPPLDMDDPTGGGDPEPDTLSLDEASRILNGDPRERIRILQVYGTKKNSQTGEYEPMVTKKGEPYRRFRFIRLDTGEECYGTRWNCDWTGDHIAGVAEWLVNLESKVDGRGGIQYTLHDLEAAE